MSSANPTGRKHSLLIAAIVCLLVAAFVDPEIMHRFACQIGVVNLAFLLIAGFLAAKGISKLADILFRGSARPWFARSGVVVFLCIIIPCINILFKIMDNMFFNITGMSQVTTQQVRMFMFMASEFMWIAILE
jgi:hypothetical protein